jgi:cell division septum initiation protein DivIVA
VTDDDRPYGDQPYDAEAEAGGGDDGDGGPAVAPGRPLPRGRGQSAEAEELLAQAVDLVEAARPMPLSSSAKLNNKDELLDVLEEVIDRLPDELREARWLRKEREEYLAKMRADGDEILDAARAHAERMVERAEIVKSAEHRARRIIDGAEAEARRLRLECEDFCDQKLAGFEIVLERTLKLVSSGRDKLQATNLSRSSAAEAEAAADELDPGGQ